MENVTDAPTVWSEALAAHAEAIDAIRDLAPQIEHAADAIVAALAADHAVLFAGNGGSAADAQHLAAELAGRFERERDPWPAIALNTNSSAVTAIGNDYGFDTVFARQVRAYGRAGGVLVALSTSGHSSNVSVAIDAARDQGMTVVALTGRDGGPIAAASDIVLNVPVTSTPRIQEAHILIGHVLCGIVEERLCAKP